MEHQQQMEERWFTSVQSFIRNYPAHQTQTKMKRVSCHPTKNELPKPNSNTSRHPAYSETDATKSTGLDEILVSVLVHNAIGPSKINNIIVCMILLTYAYIACYMNITTDVSWWEDIRYTSSWTTYIIRYL